MSNSQFPRSPLPIRDGVAPSYVWIPEGVCTGLISFLTLHFPDVKESQWVARIEKGDVIDQYGRRLSSKSVVRRGMCIFYYREIEDETKIPFEVKILHEDEHLLVVDKPHFLTVTPGGRFLQETLLVRLKKQTGFTHLTPVHRLDRETAGVMLFSHRPETRGLYQSLFQQRVVKKTYHAIAPVLLGLTFPMVHRSRMEEGDSFLVMREVEGEPNSETLIEVLQHDGCLCLYRLSPLTGKKHQLRLHMTSLGAPILNDGFYPVVLPCKGDDFSSPLQLLAKSISFSDPISGELRQFNSEQDLSIPLQVS